MFLYNSLDTSTHMYLVSKLPGLPAIFLCSCPTHWTSLPTGTRQTTRPASHFLMFLSNSLDFSAHRYPPNYPACQPFSYVPVQLIGLLCPQVPAKLPGLPAIFLCSCPTHWTSLPTGTRQTTRPASHFLMFLSNSLDFSAHRYPPNYPACQPFSYVPVQLIGLLCPQVPAKLPGLQAIFLCSCPTHWTSLPTGTRQTTRPASHFLMFLSNLLDPSAHRYLPNYPACKPFSYVPFQLIGLLCPQVPAKLPGLQAIFLCSCPTHWTSLPTGTRQTTRPASHFLMFLSNSLDFPAHRYPPNYPACKPFSYVPVQLIGPLCPQVPAKLPGLQAIFLCSCPTHWTPLPTGTRQTTRPASHFLMFLSNSLDPSAHRYPPNYPACQQSFPRGTPPPLWTAGERPGCDLHLTFIWPTTTRCPSTAVEMATTSVPLCRTCQHSPQR